MHIAPSIITPDTLAKLRAWEGRVETLDDEVTSGPLRALAATLDLDGVNSEAGDAIPPLWHWLYFLPRVRHAELGLDGHPQVGGFLPPVPLPRRMWAGGRLTWHAPLRVGDRIKRRSRIVSVKHKAGRSGDLIFVVVQHEVRTRREVLVTEEQDLVYRAPQQHGEPSTPPQPPQAEASFMRKLTPDPVLLFRYSALTFNGHRIHFDRPYATEVEGYPGLVVHGPLQATLLADLALRAKPQGSVAHFSFKALRPCVDGNPLRVCGRPSEERDELDLWIQDHQGVLTMQANIGFK